MHKNTHTIVLIGLRSSGKSTLGPMLADALGKPFVDLDTRTASALRRAHSLNDDVSISELFASLGESAFRAAEVVELERVLTAALLVDSPKPVLALGGGTPTAPGAEALLRTSQTTSTATLIYLRWRPETLAARLATGDQSDRPALLGDDPSTEVPLIFAARDPLYRKLADHVIEMDGLSPEQTLRAVLGVLTGE